jgi:hypothetical protein
MKFRPSHLAAELPLVAVVEPALREVAVVFRVPAVLLLAAVDALAGAAVAVLRLEPKTASTHSILVMMFFAKPDLRVSLVEVRQVVLLLVSAGLVVLRVVSPAAVVFPVAVLRVAPAVAEVRQRLAPVTELR